MHARMRTHTHPQSYHVTYHDILIVLQIENEYGSYRGVSCDHEYMVYLREMFHYYLGKEVVLFTTDGSGVDYLKCGTVDGVYATVDFGPGSR